MPFIEKLRVNRALNSAFTAIIAAVVGVILILAIWFAVHTFFRETVHIERAGLNFDAPLPASVNAGRLFFRLPQR